jgi:hypothetical protein
MFEALSSVLARQWLAERMPDKGALRIPTGSGRQLSLAGTGAIQK